MMKRKAVLIYTALIVFVFCPLIPAQIAAQIFGENQIPFERAVEIALAHAGGGVVTQIDWELKYGRPRFGVEVIHGGFEYEVRIDGITGNIERTKSESTRKQSSGLTNVTSARVLVFVQTALARTGGGTVREIEWERNSRSGEEYVKIEIHNNGRRFDIRVDVATNSIIRERERR